MTCTHLFSESIKSSSLKNLENFCKFIYSNNKIVKQKYFKEIKRKLSFEKYYQKF